MLAGSASGKNKKRTKSAGTCDRRQRPGAAVALLAPRPARKGQPLDLISEQDAARQIVCVFAPGKDEEHRNAEQASAGPVVAATTEAGGPPSRR